MPTLLVTNDFPPKIGGIQTYLWELWSRQSPDDVVVLTTPYPGSDTFDRGHGVDVRRTDETWLRPTKRLERKINAIAGEINADLIFLDPISPLGSIGRRLERPYVVILHGAEVNIPARLPGWGGEMRKVLQNAAGVVSAGEYALRQAERVVDHPLPALVIPPGVDIERFQPVDDSRRAELRASLGFRPDLPLVLGASRLVPRKGFDVLIDAVTGIPDTQLLIVGDGRDRDRLESRATVAGHRIRFTGAVTDERLTETYQAADIFAMPCRNRWAGLEQEGFGIVYNEAAAVGLPSVAGRSGGTGEAVVDGKTGFVVDGKSRPEVIEAVETLVTDPDRARSMGAAARARVVAELSYPVLAARLAPLVAGDPTSLLTTPA